MVVAYIGTYTKKDSEGIYKVKINGLGKVEEVVNVAKVENPTYLNFSSDKKYLYSVSKVDGNGAVSSFKIEDDGELTHLTNVALENTTPPCYVEVSHDNKYVVAANYHTGTIDSYEVGENGEVVKLVSQDKHVGSSVHERQEKAHAHFSGFSRDGKYVYSCDLGTDILTCYELKQGELVKTNEVKLRAGSGPRHLVFSHDEKYVFVMTELTSEVVSYNYDKETGELTNPSYYPTLPEDFNGENKGSAIKISNDDKFIYVSNRGQDAIVVFENKDGKLNLVQTISSYGKDPRDFNLSPDGNLAVATNEEGNITVYTVDKNSGLLTATDKTVKVPEAVCVQFV